MKRFVFFVILLSVAAVAFQASAAVRSFTLVIDAGHGGKDPGAIGKTAKEKNINLSTALAFGKLVEKNCPNVKVIYTRKSDVFVTLQGRANVANRNKADLFISIHTNALPKGKITRGAETYTLGMARAGANLEVAKRENAVILVEDNYKTTYQGFDPRSSESYIIFELMQNQNMSQSVSFAKHMQKQFKKANRIDKGVHQAGFLVLRETSCPSALIELGYITTPDEERFLSSSDGVKTMGNAIYNAFLDYYKSWDRTESSSATSVDQPAPPAPAPAPAPVAKPTKPKETDVQPVQACEQPQEQPAEQPVAEPNGDDAPATEDVIEFRVQFMGSAKKQNLSRFSGLPDIDYYEDGGLYKYTSGHFATAAEAQRHRAVVARQYSGAFVVALRNGVRIDINEAKRLSK